MLSKNPTKVKSVKVEPILRQGIERYVDQVGQLWNSLAFYYIGLGNFERVNRLVKRKIIKIEDYYSSCLLRLGTFMKKE